MSDEPIPDYVALAVSRDQRFRDLQEAVAIEHDLSGNRTVVALMRAVKAEAELAMADLADTSPLDTQAIGLISSRVRSYTWIKRTLETILTRGKIAEAEIRAQDTQYAPDER